MHVGTIFSQADSGVDPDAIRQWAITAEAAGFHHVMAYDHVLGATVERLTGGAIGQFGEPPYTDRSTFHEILTLFSHLAAVTRTIEFVPSVIVLPQRQVPLVAKQVATVRPGPDPVPAGAQRLPPHRARQVDLSSTSASPRSSAALQPALRRHQPRRRGPRVRRRDHRRHPLARLRARRRGARQRLLRPALRVGRGAGRQGPRPTSTTRTPRRSRPSGAASASRASRARSATARRRRTSACSARCATAPSPTARRCCGPRSTCRTR
jgi:hypothetical protein